MGRHTAADDATVHPLVADALSRRAGAAAGAHGEHSGSSTGWPRPEREGGGDVGWPGDVDVAPERDAQGTADRAVAPGRPTPVASRGNWRRLFGASPAA